MTQKIDHTGLKTGQALTISLLIIAFVLNIWPIVTFVAIAQLFGGLALPFAPYKLIYQHIVKSSGLVKPNPIPDNPEPHRFSMLIGALFNGAATLLFLANISIIAWILVAIVVILANVNFWLNFCLGCWFYYRLNRLGIPGFTQAPIENRS